MINDPTSNLRTYKGGFEASPPKHALLPPPQPHPTYTTFIEDQSNGLYFYKAQEILGEPPIQLGYASSFPLPRLRSFNFHIIFLWPQIVMFPCLCLKFQFYIQQSSIMNRRIQYKKKDKSNPFRTRLPFSCFYNSRFQTLQTLIYLITDFPCLTGYLNVLRQFFTFTQIKQKQFTQHWNKLFTERPFSDMIKD